MNRIQKAWAALTGSDSQKAAPGYYNGAPYTVWNGSVISPATNKQHYLNKGFNSNDIVFAATQMVSEKVHLPTWRAYRVDDEGSLDEMKRLEAKGTYTPQDLKKLAMLQKKALAPTDKDGKLIELLKYPNEVDTFQDLVANSSINKLMLGSRFIQGTILNAGSNEGKLQSLDLLPSQDVTLIVSRTWPFRVLGYTILAWDRKTFTKVEIMQDKYYNPNFDINGTHLYGFAPMQSAEMLLDRSNSENLASATAFHNGGPRIIIWVDDDKFDATQNLAQISAIKDKLTGVEYGGARNFNKMAASGYKMGATPVGLSPVDLGIAQSEKNTLRRICNVLGGLPSQLLNDPENKIYANMQEGEKALTTRAAVPLLNSFREQFNRKLGADWGYKGENIYVDYDISIYSELQEDLGKKWSWVKDLPVPNGYKLDMMGLDHPEGQEEFMGQILIPSGYGTAEDLIASPTDDALATGDDDIPANDGGADV